MTFKRLFQRQTSGGRAFIPEIDGLRFVAIMSVVLFHINAQMLRYYPTRFPTLPSFLLSHGDRGVRLFFVISGFILALPFARYHFEGGRPLPLRRYFLRRLTRLEPPYIASLLFLSVLILLVLHERPSSVALHLLASATYCHNLVFGQLSSISPVAWSLEIEVQFYILVPLITAVFALRPPVLRRSLLAFVVVSLGIAQTILPSSPRWHLSIGYYFQFFLSGLILADLYLDPPNMKTKTWCWDAISLVGWPLVFLIPDTALQWTLPTLALILYWAAFHGRLANALFRHPLIVYTGGACYSIYLLHFPVIALATRLVGHRRTLGFWLLSLVLIPTVSAVFYLLIEKPCMNPNWPHDLAKFLTAGKVNVFSESGGSGS